MRTLHFGLRVSDRERSLAFYESIGYEVAGEVKGTSHGDLTMLKLPEDEFVTIELVWDPTREGSAGGSDLNHLVIQVDSLDTVTEDLAAKGIEVEAGISPDSADELRTGWVTDPDGQRIELVQWATGHPDGMTSADFL